MHKSSKAFLVSHKSFVVRDINHQKRFSVNVWCGIFRNSLFVPILYDGTLTGDRYVNEILDVVIPDFMDELPLTVLPHVWFQQDGSPAHHTTVVKLWLNNEFPEKWIGLHGPAEFSPRSPDLAPMDFLFVESFTHSCSFVTALK
ncbi:hypothetical protein AVEN_33083-1 [Araneus ventricosus]|uniref:Tc1-like transposase DDE domain-containing protein n=1 Tax=Araneus ventricosus TaxID=182803 RepID=A0A4Y2CVD6_ARAVE|nr:hypothetical protein AVEN_33083-1 [Araneus ventricosus]